MDKAETEHFKRQLEELSRKSEVEGYQMASLSAGLSTNRYLLDNIRNQILELTQAKNAVAREILQLIGPPQTPPPLPLHNDFDNTVEGLARRLAPERYGHPQDTIDPITEWTYAQRRAAE